MFYILNPIVYPAPCGNPVNGSDRINLVAECDIVHKLEQSHIRIMPTSSVLKAPSVLTNIGINLQRKAANLISEVEELEGQYKIFLPVPMLTK